MFRNRLSIGFNKNAIAASIAQSRHDPDNGVQVGDICLYEWEGRYIYIVREIVRVHKDANNIVYEGIPDKTYFVQKYPTHRWHTYYRNTHKYPDGTQMPSLVVIQRVANREKQYKSSKKIIITSVLDIDVINPKMVEYNYNHEIQRVEQYRDMVLGLYNNRHNL